MEIYIKLFEVLFPVFFIVGIGYLLGKKSPNLDTSFITNYAANFGTPALVIFAVLSSGVTFNIFAEYFIYSLIAIIAFRCSCSSLAIWAAIILFIMGSGPIKGFSVTLGIGILTTLFSVYFIARLLTSIYVVKNKFKEKLI